MTNSAHQGRRVEWKARDYLAENGYDVVRAAGSRGPADLVAFKPGQGLVISVKRASNPPPAERAELLRVSRMLPGLVPLVAIGRPSLTFRRLTGLGAKDWEPWTADEIERGRLMDRDALALELMGVLRKHGVAPMPADYAAQKALKGLDAWASIYSLRGFTHFRPTPSVCDPNALTGTCRFDHDHDEEQR